MSHHGTGAPDRLQLETHVAKYPAIRTAVEFSQRALETLRRQLNNRMGNCLEGDAFVSVSGSVGRLEASMASDLDFMIVYPGPPPANAAAFRERLEECIEATSITLSDGSRATFRRPNPQSVFVGDVDAGKLVASIGSREEDYDSISQRLLLLLESQPLWNADGFERTREKLVSAYAVDVTADPSKEFVLLINDLIRYFRTLCVNYHSTRTTEHGKWPIRNIKLRHSRIVMYCSLLFCLGELSKFEYRHNDEEPDRKLDLLRKYVALPPLERFVRLYVSNRDGNLYRFLSLYNNFLAALSDPVRRSELAALDYLTRYDSSLFSQLKANSDAFASEIMRFLQARRGAWRDRFFEYLIL